MVRKKVKVVSYQLSEIIVEDGKINVSSIPAISIVEGTDRKIKKLIKNEYKGRDIRVTGSTEKTVVYEMETDAFIAVAKKVVTEAEAITAEADTEKVGK